jgi:hypothetical protein
MSPDDRQLYHTYQDRLEGFASTKEEKIQARQKMDELLWKGKAGGIYDALEALKIEFEEIKKMKGIGKGAVTKKTFEALAAKIETLVKALHAVNEGQEATADALQGLKDENDKLRVELGKLTKLTRENSKVAGNNAVLIASSNTAVGKSITRIEADAERLNAKVDDFATEILEDAKTSIQTEAQAAAVEAVGKLMGDS